MKYKRKINIDADRKQKKLFVVFTSLSAQLGESHPNVEKLKMKITDRVPSNIFWDIICTTTET